MVSAGAFRNRAASTLTGLVAQRDREAIERGPTRTRITGMIRGAQRVDDRTGRVCCGGRGHVLTQKGGLGPRLLGRRGW